MAENGMAASGGPGWETATPKFRHLGSSQPKAVIACADILMATRRAISTIMNDAKVIIYCYQYARCYLTATSAHRGAGVIRHQVQCTAQAQEEGRFVDAEQGGVVGRQRGQIRPGGRGADPEEQPRRLLGEV